MPTLQRSSLPAGAKKRSPTERNNAMTSPPYVHTTDTYYSTYYSTDLIIGAPSLRESAPEIDTRRKKKKVNKPSLPVLPCLPYVQEEDKSNAMTMSLPYVLPVVQNKEYKSNATTGTCRIAIAPESR